MSFVHGRILGSSWRAVTNFFVLVAALLRLAVTSGDPPTLLSSALRGSLTKHFLRFRPLFLQFWFLIPTPTRYQLVPHILQRLPTSAETWCPRRWSAEGKRRITIKRHVRELSMM